jgi:hypothetical protein
MTLLKFSIKGRRSLSIMPGLMVGMLSGLLLAASYNRQENSPVNPQPAQMLSEIEHLSTAELEAFSLKALSTLREKRGLDADEGSGAEEDYEVGTINGWRDVQLGIRNVRRLLPLARQLTLESLREAQVSDPLKRSGLSREKRLIDAVHKIVLDPSLADTAEVRDDRLSEIRIGPDYALHLISDDEAIFLLGHELTHVAARSGRLNQFIEHVTETARLSADVELMEDQKEDLACDFTGAEVLKRFIALHPKDEPEAERFARAVGYEPPAVRLARAWDDFCASYNGDAGDEEHLSHTQTLRALFGLDPKLKALMPQDSISSTLCH